MYGHSNLGRGSQLLSLSRLRPTFRANRTKRSNSTTNFSLTTCPQFYFVARPNVGRGKLAHLDLISDVLPFGRLWYGESNANRECNRLREARFAPLCWNRRDEANSRLRAHYLCSLTSIRFRYSLTSAKQHKQERQYQRDYKRTLYNCLK
jgi:hypothetical protein